MKIHFPAAISKEFHQRAKSIFPNEEYAIVLGKMLKNGDYAIHRLYYPASLAEHQQPDSVPIRMTWFEAATEIAKALDLQVLGDIHSHCYEQDEAGMGPGCDPSEDDWEWAEYMLHQDIGYRIMGIVKVLKRNGKISCKHRFWPALDLPVTVL